MKSLLTALILFVSIPALTQAQSKPLQVGDAVPRFTLIDQDGKTFNLADQIGKHILIIYFYPKDESMVCTKEACAFRDNFNDFTKAGAKVIGINSGSVQSHMAFAKNHQLPFTLLSDPDNKVLTQYGVKGKLFLTGRETFVVDLKGKVAFKYDTFMQGKEHAEQALVVVKSLKK
jgi:peroxiredoxin Q/BCP